MLDGLHVGDPFMGGATTLVEAARLGASVSGIDIDPLAVLIAQEELSSADAPDIFAEVVQQFLIFMRESCGNLYNTPTGDGTPIHFFWLRKVTCSACQTESIMYRNLVLARDVGKRGAVVRTRGIEASAQIVASCIICQKSKSSSGVVGGITILMQELTLRLRMYVLNAESAANTNDLKPISSLVC